MSKEVIATEVEAQEGGDGEEGQPIQVGEVIQNFAFWSKLMTIGDASPEICQYPSQSSVLARHEEGWASLDVVADLQPPTVELLD